MAGAMPCVRVELEEGKRGGSLGRSQFWTVECPLAVLSEDDEGLRNS